jgi:glycosyltransferase involved in cell wall biosynthesis
MMKISAIVPALNSEKTIGACLTSLLEQTYPLHEIFVVDGRSTDSTSRIVKGFKEVQLFVDNEVNTPGSSRNKGAEAASGEILYFCDSDCVMDRRAVEYHLKANQSRDHIAGVMGAIRNANPGNPVSDFFQRQIMASEWLGNLDQDGMLISHFCSANLTIRRTVFLENQFREDLVSAEDTELFLRLKNRRLKIFFEPRAVVCHRHPETVEELFSKFSWYGEGHLQIDRIHQKGFRDRYRVISPARYMDFPVDFLKAAVVLDNRLLCQGCEFNSEQKCGIETPQLMKNSTVAEVDLHRVVCLAIASGILKQRTPIGHG